MTGGVPHEFEEFLNRHTVLSLAVAADGEVWAASVFYCVDADRCRLLYYTNDNTAHARLALRSDAVAATIAAQQRRVESISGLQLRGRTTRLACAEADRAREIFAERFPEIAVADAPIWELTPDYLKLVDNSRGFGHKQEWRR